MRWFCYVLRNTQEENRTYNGMTNNVEQRIKQHNCDGPQTKGAVYTRTWGRGCWEYIMILTGDPEVFDKHEALRCEWRIKKPEGKRRTTKYVGPRNRIKGVNHAMSLERFTSNCPNTVKDLGLKIWVHEDYVDALDERYYLDIESCTFSSDDIANIQNYEVGAEIEAEVESDIVELLEVG